MMAKRSRKKPFPCGHTGKGMYCHRCAQESRNRQTTRAQQDQARRQQQAWQQTFADDQIDLHILPQRQLVMQARTILAEIRASANYHQFKEKPLRYNRQIISIPLSYDYRLLFRKTKDGLIPLRCDSHETYNKRRYD